MEWRTLASGDLYPLMRILARWVRAARLRCNRNAVEGKPAHAYPLLNRIYTRIMSGKRKKLLRPDYTWAMIQAGNLAANLGIPRFSAIEFGVAGGNGLLALECVARTLSEVFGLGIDVFGFDSGRGLPKPTDYRDLPNLWPEGTYPMDEAALRERLTVARLIVGLVEETLPAFIRSRPAPIGFISFDLDQYHSTVQAFRVLDAPPEILLPRIHCYFDDILGFTYGDHNGERLAIREFNAKHETRRQISLIYGLRYYLPRQVAHAAWAEKMYQAHILDHKLYNARDGLVCNPRRDLDHV